MLVLSFDSLIECMALLLLLKPPLTIVAISSYSSEAWRDLIFPDVTPSFAFEFLNSIFSFGLVSVKAAPLGEHSSAFDSVSNSPLSFS